MKDVLRLVDIGNGSLLGFTGGAGAGKNESGDYVSSKVGKPTYAFASPLKDSVNEMFGWGEEHKEGDLKETVVQSRTSFQEIELVIKKYFSWILEESEIRSFTEKWVAIMTMKLEECGEMVITNKNPERFRTDIFMNISPRQSYQWFGTEWGRELVNKDIWLMFAERELFKNNMHMIITDARFDNEAEWIKKLNGKIIKIDRKVSNNVPKHSSENGIDMRYVDYIVDNNDNLRVLYRRLDKLIEEVPIK